MIQTQVGGKRRLTLKALLVWFTAVCIILAVGFRSERATVQLFAMATPFHFIIWLLALLISDRRTLAYVVFGTHSVFVIGWLIWILSENDPVGRWARSFPLLYLDFPIMVLFSVLDYPPIPIAVAIWLLLGGAVWTIIAIDIALWYDRCCSSVEQGH